MGDVATRAVEILKERFADQLLGEHVSSGQKFATVRRARVLDMLKALRDDPDTRFDMLTDITAVDYMNQDGHPERFCVVYNLYSFAHNARFRVKAYLPEDDPAIDSAAALWKSAPWAEREVFDMYGIEFRGHPDLKRILLPDSYNGHPLRKDYPMRGRGEREDFPRYVAPPRNP